MSEVFGRTLASISVNRRTHDLRLLFSDEYELEVFGFRPTEVWGITFANGSSFYSNHVD
ncbi:MAG: hypothetical protein R3D67_09795 [Hyphomicrobiaceae bacterium]